MGNVIPGGGTIKRRVRVDSQHSDNMKRIIADCVAQHVKLVIAVKHGVAVEMVDTDQPGYVLDLNDPAKPFLRNTDATRENNEVYIGTRKNIELSSEESIQLIKFGYCDKFSWNHSAKSSSLPPPPAFLKLGKKILAEYNNVLVTRCPEHEDLVQKMQKNLHGLAFDALGFQYRDNPLSDLDQTAMPKDIHKYRMVHGFDALHWLWFLSMQKENNQSLPYLDIMESKWGKSITAFVPGLLYIYRILRQCFFLDLLPMVATYDKYLAQTQEHKQLYQFYYYCYDVVKIFSKREDLKHWNESSCEKEVLNKVRSDYKKWTEQLHPHPAPNRWVPPSAPPQHASHVPSHVNPPLQHQVTPVNHALPPQAKGPPINAQHQLGPHPPGPVQPTNQLPPSYPQQLSVDNRPESSVHNGASSELATKEKNHDQSSHSTSVENLKNAETALVSNGVDASKSKLSKSGEDRTNAAKVEIEIPPVGQPVIVQQGHVDNSTPQVPVTNQTSSDEDEVMKDIPQTDLNKPTLVPNPQLNSTPDQCNDNTNASDGRNENMEIDLPPSNDQPEKNQ